MIVASTIVPVATFSPFAVRCRCTSSNSGRPRSCASSRWRTRHTVVSSGTGSRPRSMPTKTTHRQRIVQRLFDRRVRQIEPMLQEIDAQHPLDPDRRAAIARLRIERLDQPAQRRPRNHALHLGKKHCPPRRLGVAVESRGRQRQLLHPPTHAHQPTPPNIIPRSLRQAFAEAP